MRKISIRGTMIKNEGGEPSFDWENAFIDAAIMGGLTFMTTLVSIGYSGIHADPVQCVIIAALSGGLQFLTILAIKRGLVTDADN